MLLNITTTHNPATDLGYLLHKHPDKFQTVEFSVGKAHIFYPEISPEKATISLLLDIDTVDMVRGKNANSDSFSLANYVNDRPYVASSFMSVAIAKAFSSALNGNCKDKPELVAQKMPFEVSISVIAAPRGGEILIRKFFEPLGYEITLERHILDKKFTEWGNSKYYSLTLKNTITTQELLSHLYLLIPALDNEKHHFISQNEVDKLLQKGEGWLKNHPEKDEIIRRYLVNLNFLSKKALAQLVDDEHIIENADSIDEEEAEKTAQELKKETLHNTRINLVAEKLAECGAKKVLDLGCGEGKLIRQLLKDKQFTEIVGTDVCYNELLKAKKRLNYDEMPPKQQQRITLFQSSLTYIDKRFKGFDAAALVEVIEHLDLNRLRAFERVVFEFARPQNVILTTPNQEYNVVWESLPADKMRHNDHRFEWTRQEFADWTNIISEKFGYTVAISGIGEEVKNVGTPSQMAVFSRI